MPVNRSNALPDGTLLRNGAYTIAQQIGSGGQSRTYRAVSSQGHNFAIKELFPLGSQREGTNVVEPETCTAEAWRKIVEGFLRESHTLINLRLNHPNIVNVFEYFEVNNTAYIVMRYVNGPTLEVLRQRQGGKLPEPAVLYYANQLCDALSILHANGIIHRDIKPENIMVEGDHAILIDFSIAREFIADHTTRQTMGAGTVKFAPPEQLTAHYSRLGPYTDIFALAATCYYLLTGDHYPYYDRPRERRSEISPTVWAALTHAMAVSPANRPQSVVAFQHELLAPAGGRLWSRMANWLGGSTNSASTQTRVPQSLPTPPVIRAPQVQPPIPPQQIARTVNFAGTVLNAMFSPDGQRILIGSANGKAQLYDAAGNPSKELTGHRSAVNSIAYSPNGQLIATASHDGTVRIWDSSGEPQAILCRNNEPMVKVSISPKENTVMAVAKNGYTRCWNTAAVTVVDFGETIGAMFSPKGSFALVLSRHFDNSNGKKRLNVLGEFYHCDRGSYSRKAIGFIFHNDLEQLSFSPSEHQVFVSSSDKQATFLYNFYPNSPRINEVDIHVAAIQSASFNPLGDTLLTGSADFTACLWNLDGVQKARLSLHEGAVNKVLYSPDGTLILTASEDTTARLWDASGKARFVLRGHSKGIYDAAFSPSGEMILTVANDNTVRLWSVNSQPGPVLEHPSWVVSASFSADGQRILTQCEDRTARLWGVDGKLMATFT